MYVPKKVKTKRHKKARTNQQIKIKLNRKKRMLATYTNSDRSGFRRREISKIMIGLDQLQ